MRNILIILSAIFIISLPVSAQEKTSNSKQREKDKTQNHGMKEEEEEDENPFPLRPLEFGLNFGAYFANKYSANFYNGSDSNVNTVKYIMSNPTWYREIKLALGADSMVQVIGYPTDMHYNVALTGGLFVRYNFNRRNSIFLEANYTQLRAADVVTLQVDSIYTWKLPDIRMVPIIGKEGRVMIDLGYQRSFPLKSRINLFIQGGITMCYTQVIKSVFVVEGREYNLINIYGNQGYQQNTNQQTFNVNQNAFGFGGFLGVGAGIPLTDLFGIEPGFFVQYYPVNLEGYPDFKPSFGLYLRILLNFVATED